MLLALSRVRKPHQFLKPSPLLVLLLPLECLLLRLTRHRLQAFTPLRVNGELRLLALAYHTMIIELRYEGQLILGKILAIHRHERLLQVEAFAAENHAAVLALLPRVSSFHWRVLEGDPLPRRFLPFRLYHIVIVFIDFIAVETLSGAASRRWGLLVALCLKVALTIPMIEHLTLAHLLLQQQFCLPPLRSALIPCIPPNLRLLLLAVVLLVLGHAAILELVAELLQRRDHVL